VRNLGIFVDCGAVYAPHNLESLHGVAIQEALGTLHIANLIFCGCATNSKHKGEHNKKKHRS
jgi:hypothetical protein